MERKMKTQEKWKGSLRGWGSIPHITLKAGPQLIPVIVPSMQCVLREQQVQGGVGRKPGFKSCTAT